MITNTNSEGSNHVVKLGLNREVQGNAVPGHSLPGSHSKPTRFTLIGASGRLDGQPRTTEYLPCDDYVDLSLDNHLHIFRASEKSHSLVKEVQSRRRH